MLTPKNNEKVLMKKELVAPGFNSRISWFPSNHLKIVMAMAVLITSNTQVNTFVSSLDHLFLPLKVRDTGWGGAFALLTQKLQV